MITFDPSPVTGVTTIIIDGVLYTYNGVGYEVTPEILDPKNVGVSGDNLIIQDSEAAGEYKVISLGDLLLDEEEW